MESAIDRSGMCGKQLVRSIGGTRMSGRRIGARSYADITKELLTHLQSGETETATHVEQMAVDMRALLTNVEPGLSAAGVQFEGHGFVERMRIGGRVLWSAYGREVVNRASTWKSDIARGWAAMAVGEAPGIDLHHRLVLVEPFAKDEHFAVREWAWLSLRPHVAAAPPYAVGALTPWVQSEHSFMRRFAVEVTRPRSVWGTHIPLLKDDPDVARPLLDPLKCEPSAYVARSVGNWLNDAAKSRPRWSSELVSRWVAGCACVNTARVARLATRRIRAPR